MMRILLIVGAFALLTACNGNSAKPLTPTGTFTASVTRETSYSGTIIDSVIGTGSVTVIINSSAGTSSPGTWIEVFPGQKSTTRFISGTLDGTSYRATVSDCRPGSSTPCSPNCQQAFTGTLTSSTLSGAYAEVPGDSCATVRSGNINAAKQ